MGPQVIRSLGCQVTLSSGHQVIRLLGHKVVQPLGHQVIMSSGRQVIGSSGWRETILTTGGLRKAFIYIYAYLSRAVNESASILDESGQQTLSCRK